jgi:hypothetical protein
LDKPYKCAKVVVVHGFIANAALDVEVAGAIVISGFPGAFPIPNGTVVPLPNELIADQKVRARQHYGGATSGWPKAWTTADHAQEYPAGPPSPEINPAPVYKCGARTGVSNLWVGSERARQPRGRIIAA